MANQVPRTREDLFRCDFFELNLLGSACLKRQASDPNDEENKHRLCASGTCAQGLRVKAALEREPMTRGDRLSSLLLPPLTGRERGEPPPFVTPPAPKPAPRVCRGFDGLSCQVELGPMNDDGLCPRHRRLAFDASKVAPASIPPPEPDEAPAEPEEKPMAEERKQCSVTGCEKKLRIDNRSGVCSKHSSYRQAAPRVVLPDQVDAFPNSGPILPDVREVPVTFLIACIGELKRRHAEMVTAMRAVAEFSGTPASGSPSAEVANG